MRTQYNQTPSLESVFGPVISALTRLVDRLRDGQNTNGDVDELRNLVETLPLSTDEFGLACNRLRNAQRYLLANEAGAAQWELDALRKRLRTTIDAQGGDPRRGW